MPTADLPYTNPFGTGDRPYLWVHLTGIDGRGGSFVGLLDTGADRTAMPIGYASLLGYSPSTLTPVTIGTASSPVLENIFRSVNIALVNELAMLTDRMGIDIWEVIDAASTKPYGFMRLQPGPGMGGHCPPVDPFYLSWRAREYDMVTEFIELAGKSTSSPTTAPPKPNAPSTTSGSP